MDRICSNSGKEEGPMSKFFLFLSFAGKLLCFSFFVVPSLKGGRVCNL
jgi:hypothetical protein